VRGNEREWLAEGCSGRDEWRACLSCGRESQRQRGEPRVMMSTQQCAPLRFPLRLAVRVAAAAIPLRFLRIRKQPNAPVTAARGGRSRAHSAAVHRPRSQRAHHGSSPLGGVSHADECTGAAAVGRAGPTAANKKGAAVVLSGAVAQRHQTAPSSSWRSFDSQLAVLATASASLRDRPPSPLRCEQWTAERASVWRRSLRLVCSRRHWSGGEAGSGGRHWSSADDPAAVQCAVSAPHGE
jgi:hypothetical protein